VPTKERVRCDHEGAPALSRQSPARRREERPVTVPQLRAPDGAAQDLHLVAEDRILQLKLRRAPTSGEHSDEANEHEVDERSHGARDATCERQSSAAPSFGAPQEAMVIGAVGPEATVDRRGFDRGGRRAERRLDALEEI